MKALKEITLIQKTQRDKEGNLRRDKVPFELTLFS
jgi:hypothetical protein